MDASSPQLIYGVAATTQYRDREDIEESLAQLLLQFLEARSVALLKLVRDAAGDKVIPYVTTESDNSTRIAGSRGGPKKIALAEHPIWQQCVDLRMPQITPTPDGFEATFPIMGEAGEVAGLLQVMTSRAPDARELHLVAGILQIIRNHIALIDYGERDTLTGLLNRKTFEAQFEKTRAIIGAQPAGATAKASWMGMVDVDRFKSINDRFGHVFGDEVLLLVSQIIQRSFRGADRMYRFGGEEFVILLQDTPEEATAGALERLRAAIEKHQFPQIETVTISIGWTQIRPQDAPANCVERADLALYHAKRTGRNKVCHYEGLLASGELAPTVQQSTPEIELF
jgi:diguanylate cyclase (GGDEF)-like protein